ncbi:MAG: Ig-like domain-containing protein, partial [Rhodocyclaceae bacterium]
PVVSAETYVAPEGVATILGNVLANDTDAENDPLTVFQVATDGASAAVAVNGSNAITTALGGTVVMNTDGTFTYTTPARIHNDATPDQDSFVYKAYDGSLASDWVTVTLDIADSAPTAVADTDMVGHGDTTYGNVITGAGGGADSLGADAAAISNVTYGGSEISNTVAGDIRTIVTSSGTLTVNQLTGEYSYQNTTPNLVVPATINADGWRALGVDLFGFDGSDPYSGGDPSNGLVTAALDVAAADKVRFRDRGGVSDDGLGVETTSGNNTSTRIQSGEALVVDMNLMSRSATVTLTNLSGSETATWHAYDSTGAHVATGTIDGNSSNIATATISTGTPFQYIVFASSGATFRLNGLNAIPEVPDQVFTYTLTDADGSTSSASLTIAVSGTNASPTAVADTGAVSEDATLTVSTASGVIQGAPGTDADADDATNTLSVSGVVAGAGGVAQGAGVGTAVTGAYGTLTLNADGSYTYVADQPAADALSAGATASDVFSYTVTDPNGAVSNSTTLTITITGTNDAPTLDLDTDDSTATGTAYVGTFTEGGGGVPIGDIDLAVSDPDSTITGATITLGNPKAGDVLATGALPAGITATVAGNVVLLSGAASAADYQTAIRAITFDNASSTPDTTPRNITVTVTDGALASNTATATISVVAVNDAPVLDLDASAVGSGYNAFFSVDARPDVPVGDTDIVITDADSAIITGATITLTNPQTGDVLSVGSLPAGISATVAGNVVTLSGSAFITDYQLAIRAVSFNNAAGTPDLTARSIEVTVTDGSNNSNTAVTTINMIAANVAPTADAASASGNEDTLIPITLTGSDPDGSVANFTLANLPAYGQLYLDAAMTQLAPTGTLLAATGNALTLYYKPPVDWNGSAGFDFNAVDNLGGVSPSAAATIAVTPVSDGAPLAADDSYTTVLGTPINISKADLLANDTLFDHAAIISSSSIPGLVDNGSYFTWTPGAAGTASFTYTLQDDDGQTSTATVNLTAHGALDDLATVQESALIGGAGSNVVGGNLFAGTETNTSVLSINGIAPVGGVITVTTSIGQLVVNSTNGDYTYTLNNVADNSAPADDTGIVEVFNYVGNTSSATLRVTVQDDRPIAADAEVMIPESNLPSYNIVLVVDSSGSMTEDVRSVAADGTVTVMTRMDVARIALTRLVQEYFSQSADVQVRIVDFDSTATIVNGGAWFTTEEAAVGFINNPANLAAAGGTDYREALDDARTALGSPTAPDAARQNIVYFISDGDPTENNTATGITNYLNYIAGSNVQSFAVGIGTGIGDPSWLNQIHNADSLGDGSIDEAIIVPDVSRLEEQLLATVPAAYGGNVVSANSSQGIVFGADGGYISSISILLDTDGNPGTPEQNVTFSYDSVANTISSSGPFPPGFPASGNLLTLNAAKGFSHGILVFDFESGDYTYYTAGVAGEGDTFDLAFTANDLDGDAVSAVQTIRVVDGKPIANPDTDTLTALDTFLEGNVVTGVGTDGGSALGAQLTNFTPQGSGVDVPADNAGVTSIVFKGVTYNLTVDSSGSASGGSYTISGGQLTWTHSSDGSQLVFGDNGYYRYTPPAADVPSPATGPTNLVVNFTSAAAHAGTGVTLQGVLRDSNVPGSAPVSYSGTNGAGVTSPGDDTSNLDDLESLVIDFDRGLYAQGVQGLRFQVYAQNASAVTFTFFGIDGEQIGQQAIDAAGGTTTWFDMPATLSNVSRVTALVSDATYFSAPQVRIRAVEFDGVLNDPAAAPVAPEQIEYTLTDSDGDTSTSSLTLNVIRNHFAGDGADNAITGTAANDRIVGLGGDDTIAGGAGNDIIEAGDGDDSVDGGDGDDTITGGAGNDIIDGGAGNDVLRGQDGTDTLMGGDGDDRLEGGAGDDVLIGGAGDDVLIGGPGTDTLTGGLGADVFRWELADRGVKGNPATDTVTDFDPAAAVLGGDVLDLRDLLSNESHTAGSTGNLSSFLHFEQSGSDTLVHVSTTGGFSGGFIPNQEDHAILLQGVDLIGGFSTDQQVIQDLLNKGKLITD